MAKIIICEDDVYCFYCKVGRQMLRGVQDSSGMYKAVCGVCRRKVEGEVMKRC